MRHKHILLTRNQWIGVIVLIILLALVFVALHFLPTPPPPKPKLQRPKKAYTHHTKEYYDSIRQVKQAHYDSLRLVRRDSLYQLYQAHRDSTRQVDSLWWDSVTHINTPRIEKKDTVLSLNAADTTSLKMIYGIGSGMARRIVRYREQLGGYAHVEQLLDDQLYQDHYGHSIRSKYCLSDSILHYFTIEKDSIKPIPVNHASIERLQAHPYISHTLAKEIYTLRRQRVCLDNIDELGILPHANDSLLQRLAPYLSFDR